MIIFTVDENRVVLRLCESYESDYINASYIQVSVQWFMVCAASQSLCERLYFFFTM